MKLIIFFTLFVTLISNVYADGYRLIDYCTFTEIELDGGTITNAKDQEKSTFCLGYVAGIRDSLLRNKQICTDGKVKNAQAVRIVLKFLRYNPKTLHVHEVAHVTRALQDAFPCN